MPLTFPALRKHILKVGGSTLLAGSLIVLSPMAMGADSDSVECRALVKQCDDMKSECEALERDAKKSENQCKRALRKAPKGCLAYLDDDQSIMSAWLTFLVSDPQTCSDFKRLQKECEEELWEKQNDIDSCRMRYDKCTSRNTYQDCLGSVPVADDVNPLDESDMDEIFEGPILDHGFIDEKSLGSPFTDTVPDWAEDAILDLHGIGIIKGYEDGSFGASDPLTKAQVMTLLYRTLIHRGIITPPDPGACNYFDDVQSGDFMFLPVCLFVQHLLDARAISEAPSGNFDPHELVTRGEVAEYLDTMLGATFIDAMRTEPSGQQIFSDVPPDHPYFQSANFLHHAGLMTGNPDGSFGVDSNLNRAEAAIVSQRTLRKVKDLGLGKIIKKLRKGTMGKKYLNMCSDLIKDMTKKCAENENWQLDVIISRTDFLNPENSFEMEEFIVGPNNKCEGTFAGEKYPLDINSEMIDSQKATARDGKPEQSYEVVCSVACYAWTCPEGEGEWEKTYKCKQGTYRHDGDCESECPSHQCARDHTQLDKSCWVCVEHNLCKQGQPLNTCLKICPVDCQVLSRNPDCGYCRLWEPAPKPQPRACSGGGHDERDQCQMACRGNCFESYDSYSKRKCWYCQEPEPVYDAPPEPEEPEQTQVTVPDQPEPTEPPPPPEPEPEPEPECPTGTTENQAACGESCTNGLCVQKATAGDKACYACLKCPEETSSDKSACESDCDNVCAVTAQEGELQCWQCQKSCEDICKEHDYEIGTTSYSSFILGELNDYTCVSGASISMPTATIGDCSCSRQPTVTIDQTPPICEGTPCGDVQCNQSAECTIGNTHYTVSCGWGGWEEVGENQFVPVIGGVGE